MLKSEKSVQPNAPLLDAVNGGRYNGLASARTKACLIRAAAQASRSTFLKMVEARLPDNNVRLCTLTIRLRVNAVVYSTAS